MTRYMDGTASAWFFPNDAAWERDDPITLVTLRLDPAADDGALHFLESAEREALDRWTASGTVLMALVSQSRRELNLVIACNDEEARRAAEEIPSVASELAEVEVRGVVALALAGAHRLVMH
ncbi:hypothetical protein [Erythrobacter sp. CCH5-A1]|uniref:hypothetical protein n=1 Tax=Erythrobacter sp. CCH5-A1 TaxID=1768792 RepID=UPI0012E3F900|nr:hypothetical protein [Erythrobacter sp. CCH5-A1]